MLTEEYIIVVSNTIANIMSIAEQLDPLVPSSDRPPKHEWTNHFWYVMHTWALLAKADADAADVRARIALFASAHAGLPCAKCRTHYKERFAARPYTEAHARDNRLGMQWITDLRREIQEGIDKEEADEALKERDGTPAQRSKYLSCLPEPPTRLYRSAYESLHSPAANARRQDAIERALRAMELNLKTKADCGCNMRDPSFKRSQKFCAA